MKDYYRILEVNYHSSQEDIELAYEVASSNSRRLGNHMNQELLDEAYSVLSDADQRQVYNRNFSMFSKESEVTNVVYSNLYYIDDNMKSSELNQEDEETVMPNSEVSNHISISIYKFMTIGFALLSACLFIILLFGNNQGLSTELNSNGRNKNNEASAGTDDASSNTANGSITSGSSSTTNGNISNDTTSDANENGINATTTNSNTSRNNVNDSIITAINPNEATKQYNTINEGVSVYQIIDNAMITDTAHNPQILFITKNHVSLEEDFYKITNLVQKPRYLMKDPYPELNHVQKTKKLMSNTEEFFDHTFTNIRSDDDSTIKSVFQQNNADISYHAKSDKAYMFIYVPALYVVNDGIGENLQKDIYLFIMYEIEVINGGVYAKYSPINPFTMYVTKKLYSIDSLLTKDSYWFKYITIHQAREIHDRMLSEISLDKAVVVEKDLSDGYLEFHTMHLDTRDIKKLKETYEGTTYRYQLQDPYQHMTEIEKIDLLNSDPESFFDAVLIGVENKKGTTLKGLLHTKDAEWEYFVDGNKAYMYLSIPTVTYKSDGYDLNQLELDLFIMYELKVLPDGIYAKYEITNPFALYITEKSFYQGLTPEGFRWEYGIAQVKDTAYRAIEDYYNMIQVNWAFIEEIRTLTIQTILRNSTIK